MGHWPLTAGVGAALAGCENTTTPVAAAGGGGRRQGHPRRPDRGRPGRQRRHPARAPRLPGRPAQARRPGRELGQARARRRAADLQLRRLPQPGGHQGVRQAGGRQRPRHHLRHARRGVLEAQHRRPRVRRHLLDARPALAARRPQAHPAAELRADPEPAEERLARAAQPVLRRRPALQRPVRRPTRRASRGATTCSTSTRARWTSRGTRSGRRRPRSTAARWRSSTTRARRPGMALMRRGVTDLNTEDPDLLDARRRRPQAAQRQRVGVKVSIADYETVPAGRVAPAPGLVGRHDRRRHLLHAQGRQARRALLLVPEAGRPDLQRLHLRRGQGDEAGHRAPLPQLHARQQGRPTRTSRATSATSRRSPRSTPASSSTTGILPKTLSEAVVTREAYANGNAYLTLSAKGLQLWDRDLGVVPQRLMGSRWIWRALALPGLAWLALFFVVAFYAIISVGLGNVTTLYEPVPHWNPLDWNVGYIWAALKAVRPGRRHVGRLPAHDHLRRRRGGAVAGHRLPGRVVRGAPRRALARARSSCCSSCPSGSAT